MEELKEVEFNAHTVFNADNGKKTFILDRNKMEYMPSLEMESQFMICYVIQLERRMNR